MIRNFCLTLLGLAAAGTVGAQQAATAADTGDTGTLQEVVVTARRFAEDLQNVPIAVTAIGAAAIQTQDVTNL